MFVSFDHWTKGRSVTSWGTNAGSAVLPFQRWRHFKEAFAPEVVEEAVRTSPIPVQRCLDPFGGSGTTALACQFLGVKPTTVEVNPYLADLIEAKLASYDSDHLIASLGSVLRSADQHQAAAEAKRALLPATFVEPGVKDRWIFDRAVADRVLALAEAVAHLPDEAERRLLRVLLGGILLGVSNVVVNGKGRRYRRGWEARQRTAGEVDTAFADAASSAIAETHRFAGRQEGGYRVIRGDSRSALVDESFELAVFSPPYPNSFDYTDVYNIELWMLGYLQSFDDNKRLRQATLASHVQVHRQYAEAPQGSPSLDKTITALEAARPALWSKRIPEMVGAYFAEMAGVIGNVGKMLVPGGTMWIVVGDSRYAEIPVETAVVLAELAIGMDLRVERIDVLRDMRASAQQGGQYQLGESLIVLRRP